MEYPTEDEVREILREHEERLDRALRLAWDDWLKVPNRSRYRARTRANMVFDFICVRINEAFEGVDGVRVLNRHDTMKVVFRDRLLVRFKKANRDGLGSNIPTQEVLRFIDPQLNLPGLSDAIRVEITYRLDPLATRIASLAVTARERFRKLWSYELAATTASNVAPLPTSAEAPKDAEVRIRRTEEGSKDKASE